MRRLLVSAGTLSLRRFCAHRAGTLLAFVLLVVSGPALLAQKTITTTTLTMTASSGSAAPVAQGTVVTLTASVTAGTTPVTVGQVDLCDAAATYCTDIHILGTAQLTSAGTAIFHITPGAGTRTYKALFRGTTASTVSTSATQSVSVVAGKSATTTAVRANGSAGIYKLDATVSTFGNTGLLPSGPVQFVDVTAANAILGSATLSPSSTAFSMVSSPAPSFQAKVVATGDFNNDGRADILTFDGSGKLNVALGNGDGTFHSLPAAQLLSASPVSATAVGDFDADGKPDLAVICGGGVTILLGQGDGTFAVGASPAVGGSPASLAVGDFNGDGTLDLAVANDASNNVSILLGRGDGTFAIAGTVGTGAGPGKILTADFDKDGVLDLAVLTLTNYTVSIFHGNGDGTFTALSKPAYVGFDLISMATADLNGDGVADIVITGFLGDFVPMLSRGDGTFIQGASPTPFSTSLFYGELVFADFNGDGKLDVAVSNPNGFGVTGPYIFTGNGDGTFNLNGPFAGVSSESIAAADFNGDGSSDIVFVNGYATTSQPLMLLLGESGLTATATATAISPIGTGTHQVMAVYAGDTRFMGSTSATLGLAATPVTPTLALSANPSSSTFGQQVVLTARLAPSAEPGLSSDGESVAFYFGFGGSYLGSAPLVSGLATLNVTSLPVGANSLTAQYRGDADLTAVTSGAVSFRVAQASPTITWHPPANATYSGNALGTLLNATSAVSGAFTYTATPTGGSPTVITASSVLGVGSYTITARFAPFDTTDYNPASSTAAYTVSPAALTVLPLNTARVYGAANPTFSPAVTGALNGDMFNVTGSTTATASSSVGTYPVTYVVTGANLANYIVSSSSGGLTVTPAPLIVTALNATRVFGTANPVFTGTVNGAVQGDSFTESFATAATTASAAGTYAIVPSVNGPSFLNYTVVPANGALAVTQAGTTTTIALSNGNLTLTANVASITSGTPTGSVSFYSGQTLIGTGALTGGLASYTASSSPVGDTPLSAQYSGDVNFTTSASTPVLPLIVAPSSTSLAVAHNGSVTDILALTVASGYAGTVQFSCSGLPANTVCSFQPASVVFNGAVNSVNVMLTVQTSQAHAANVNQLRSYGKGVPLFALFVAPGLLTVCVARRKYLQGIRLLALLILTGAAVALVGCGGSSSSASNPVTPTGSSSFQVIASGSNGLSQTTTVHLMVQ